MFLVNQKSVTLLTHISPITSSKIIHSKPQHLLLKKSPTLIVLMLFSVPTSTEESLATVHFLQATHPTSPGYFTFWTHSPSVPQLKPDCKANKNLCFPPSLCITLCPSTNPKATHSKSPCSFAGNIGNWSLTTACRTPVYWPQRTVSSHPGSAMLLLTVSCKTVGKSSYHQNTWQPLFFSNQQGLLLCLRRKRDWFQVIYSWQIHASSPAQILVPFKGFMIRCLIVCSMYWQVNNLTTNPPVQLFLLVMDRHYLSRFSRTPPVLHEFLG